jgi:hypothetical protein
MFTSRMFAFAAVALAGFSLVVAAPTAEKDVVVKRGGSEDQILSILTGLTSACASPLGSISSFPPSPRNALLY